MTTPETLASVEKACAELVYEQAPVTFTVVATRTGVSRATLYRDSSLRAVVEEHRQRSHDPRSLSGLSAEVHHLRTAVEALADKVRGHEEALRRIDRARRAR